MNALCTPTHTPFNMASHSLWKLVKTSIAQRRQRSNEKNHPIRYIYTHTRTTTTHTHTHVRSQLNAPGKLTPWTGLFFRFAPCANENENPPELCGCCDYIVLMPFLVFHPYGQTGWTEWTAWTRWTRLLASWTVNRSRYSLSACQGCQAASSWPLVALVMASRWLGSFCSYRSPPTRIRTHPHTHTQTDTRMRTAPVGIQLNLSICI